MITKDRLISMQQITKVIAQDTEDDAKNFDGKPFNGRTVAEYFGNQGAAIKSLAKMVDVLIQNEINRGE